MTIEAPAAAEPTRGEPLGLEPLGGAPTGVAEETGGEPTVAADEHQRRIAAVRHAMGATGVTAVAAAGPEDVYYLTGLDHLGYFAFTLLVLGPGGPPVLVTRAMERPTIADQVPWCRQVTFGDGETPTATAAAAIASLAGPDPTVALDEGSSFFPPAIAAGIRDLLPNARWRSGTGLLAALRAVKSPAEVAAMRAAARAGDHALAAGFAAARPGASDRDVAAAICRAMIEAGGELPGFPPLIRPTSLLDREHVTWSGRALRPGSGLFVELSASVRRYHAPQSRTVYLETVPPDAVRAADAALAGLLAARDALRPGATTGDVYAAWQQAVAAQAGTGLPARHHCGYLVGIGFPPSWVGGGEVRGIQPGGTVRVRAGMTFHLMSWVTEPAGHVVSDTALVTPTGAELLTGTSRDLTVLRWQ